MTEDNILQVDEGNWGAFKKLFFLFVLCYTILYIVPISFIQGTYLYSLLCYPATFIGHHIFHINNVAQIADNGSGDTLFDYLKAFALFLTALIVAPIIFFITGKRRNYETLQALLVIALRYYLGFIMIGYGLAKIFYSQFPPPASSRMEQTYGSSSPMGLLWTFMGYSLAYNIFCGLAEFIAGLLLLFRRTAVFGALLSLVVIINIFMLNMCYDVPVKLFSANLIFFTLVILSPRLKTLFSFFFLQKTQSLSATKDLFKAGWLKIIRIIVKILAMVYVAWGIFIFSVRQREEDKLLPIYALYNVKTFVAEGDTVLPLTTDTNRWKTFELQKNYALVITMNDKAHYYKEDFDSINKTITFTNYRQPIDVFSLGYKLNNNVVSFAGNIDNRQINITGEKKNTDNYLLVKRGFHWINEYPFNR